jgi:hypothetical protein
MRLGTRRPLVLLVVALVALIALVAIPALAASPSPPTGSSASPRADESQKPGKGPKKEKVPEVAVTLTGTVGSRTNAEGEAEYTLSVGSVIYTLKAGPDWYWKDAHPLKPYSGKSVTIVGEQAQGTTEVDVQSVDGKVIREPGKPPWAGGWKRVGKDHPGWSQDKADRWAAKVADKKARFGLDCWPPGQCKDASGEPATPNATATPAP